MLNYFIKSNDMLSIGNSLSSNKLILKSISNSEPTLDVTTKIILDVYFNSFYLYRYIRKKDIQHREDIYNV